MICPNCNTEMRKVRWEITNNFKVGSDFKEYDKITYECKADDIWIHTEIPMAASSTGHKELAHQDDNKNS